jgi:hypothetical protein
VLAGVAGEVAVVPEWLLFAVVFSSIGAAPLELRHRSAVTSLVVAPRSAREDFPFAVSERWRIRRLMFLKAWLLFAKMVLPFVAQGGGAQVPRSVDFLVAKGSLPVQGFGGGAAFIMNLAHFYL